MKIYTKTGDTGSTSLLGKESVLKSDLRVEAYGSVDELNATIGILVSEMETIPFNGSKDISKDLIRVQNRLFVIGSHLACVDPTFQKSLPEFKTGWVAELESKIDAHTADLPQQKEFILPGGTKAASASHLCRTVCRRAERRTVELHQTDAINEEIIIYLNRLSDYFHTTARLINHAGGHKDVAWAKE